MDVQLTCPCVAAPFPFPLPEKQLFIGVYWNFPVKEGWRARRGGGPPLLGWSQGAQEPSREGSWHNGRVAVGRG